MSKLVEEVLGAWREAERLLEELPPIDPDHETVRLSVLELRDVYQRLTDARAGSATALQASREVLDSAGEVLRRARARLDGRA
jgi:hypothetical protein